MLSEDDHRIRPEAIGGRHPFGCANAHYEIANLSSQELFQGALDQAFAEAQGLSVAAPVETLKVACDTDAFDFHPTEESLVTALDNAILTLKRVSP